MKRITVYEARDGSIWPTESEALEIDADLDRAEQILARLVPRPGAWFDGYIQQDPAVVREVQALFEQWVYERFPELQGESIHPRGMNTRWLDAKKDEPLLSVRFRLGCIDEHSREWEHWYFAINPGTGNDVRLNAETP